MPIIIPEKLPAKEILEGENIFVITEKKAQSQEIRALRLLILNLMPTKLVTETQLLRKLSNTPIQIEIELLQTMSYTSKNTSAEHMESFYKAFTEIKDRQYDGMIITGAPVENLQFDEVDYWEELCEIMRWTKTNVQTTLHICWGAQAALYYHYGVNKHQLDKKVFGIFEHKLLTSFCPLFRGFDDIFYVPHSRHTTILAEDILKVPNLELLSVSDEAGVYAVKSTDGSQIFITAHPEYDDETLSIEYFRDIEKGSVIEAPKNYFPNDDCGLRPIVNWRAHGQLLYSNWVNYYVYNEGFR